MIGDPQISVIIPAYNAARWIERSIGSVLSQENCDLELWVINDGSTDRTSQIAKSIADPRLHVLDTSNKGVSEARNAGIEKARGKFISFLDADDAMAPECLATKLQCLKERDADWVFGDLILCDEELIPTGQILAGTDGDVLRNIILGTGKAVPAPCSNILVRRKCFDEGVRFDPRLSNAADQDLMVKLSRYRYAHLPKALNLYRQVPGSMSRNMALHEKDHLRLFENIERAGHLRDRTLKRHAMANAYWSIGGSWWVNGNSPIRAIPYVIRAIIERPSILLEKTFRSRSAN